MGCMDSQNLYCTELCPVGTRKKEEALRLNNSVFEAVSAVQLFIETCSKTCTRSKEKQL